MGEWAQDDLETWEAQQSCSLCDGVGDIPARRSPVIIGPETEYTEGDRIVCPRCDGGGKEP